MQRIYLIVLFLTSILTASTAQVCNGNLGENIFESGDFGEGIPNILPDPGIAPGYNYTGNPPPVDGFYVITNNTGAWPGLYGTWLGIGDNSTSPNGYMMVVNASFSPGLFYEQEVEGLCENTLYEFSADVINLIKNDVTDHLEPNVSFLLDGVDVYSTGNIGQTQQWNTYGFTFTTDPGQTVVTLSLRNNAPGGIGNDLGLDNISFRACGPEALILPESIANICEDGDPLLIEATVIGDQYPNPAFQWQTSTNGGITWVDIPGETGTTYAHTDLASGMYFYRYLLANNASNIQNSKCRVVSNVKVINVVPKFYEIIDSLCEGLSYTVGLSTYDATGVYVDSLISSLGCDSIVTLDLTIVLDLGIEATVEGMAPLCFGIAEGNITVSEVINGNPPLQISLNDEPPGMDTLFGNLSGGDYLITIEDRFGCTFQEAVNIVDPQPFIVELGPDTCVNLGDFLELNPFASQPVDTFSWFPSDLFPCDFDCWNPEWPPATSGEVVLSAISPLGCIALDTILVEVKEVRKVYIPNIFSANFDGYNDAFTVYGEVPNIQSILKLQVFDRWGELVFESNNFAPNQESAGWDGTFKGKDMDEGVFVYLAEVLFLDNVVLRYSGDVLLMR